MNLNEILTDIRNEAEALTERVEEPPPELTEFITQIEVGFGIPVYVTSDQYRRLSDLIEEIVCKPYNQPKNGVHWVSGDGPPPNLQEEGSTDTSLHQVRCTARTFVSEKERARVDRKRASVGTCSECGELQFATPSGANCKNGHGGAPSL